MKPGFTFNGVHSSEYDITFRSVDRPLRPEVREREIIIPSRHGSYDFEGNKFSNRLITVTLQFQGSSLADLRRRSRDIGAWLHTESYKELIFDDEPDVYHQARIYGQVGLSGFFASGEATVIFKCQPFKLNINTSLESFIATSSGASLEVINNGTFDTPIKLTITNLGSNTLAGFTVSRKQS